MDLPALYDLFCEPKRTNADGTLRLPSWELIALTAHVDPLNDAHAVRALIEKGAMTRRTVPNTWGDVEYRMVKPAPEERDAFYAVLRTIGARWA